MALKNLTRVLVIVGALGWTGVAHASLLVDDLAAYWNLDEASGSRFDSVGSSHLTDNNTVSSNPGIINNAAQFVTTNGEFLSSADNAALSPAGGDFTATAWVYLDSKIVRPAGNARRYLLSKGSENNGTFEWAMLYDHGGDTFVFSTSVGSASSTSFGSPELGVWNFVTAWRDSSPLNRTVNIQVNNGPIDLASTPTTIADLAGEFRIGGEESTDPVPRFWDGRVDEVGFWKRILTAEERKTLYEDPGALFRGTPPSEPVIPEPSSLLLLGSGLLGLWGWRRHNLKSKFIRNHGR